MSDWADEKAEFVDGWAGVYLSSSQMEKLAEMFRAARNEALEEAASSIDDCEPGLAEWIRQLKDKQP